MKNIRILSILLLALLLPGQVLALIPTDRRQRLTEGWEFIRQDMGSIWEVMRPVPGPGKPEAVPLWQKVGLPHCFNAEDATDPDVNYYQGPGWYRTLLDIDNPYAGGRTYLEFEGAGQKSEVYVYTTRVATHVGGYDEWKADITEAVEAFRRSSVCHERFGGRIPVAVRCDNSRDTELMPSDMSDFNLYGGLYRYVNLVYTPALRFGQIRIDATTDERGKQGKVEISLSLEGQPGEAHISLSILDPEGREVWKEDERRDTRDERRDTRDERRDTRDEGRDTRGQREPRSLVNSSTCQLSLDRPTLWTPDAPALYTCVAELACGGDTLRATRRFGFRHIRFEEHGPFYLNGKRLLLRGTHRHEDHAGVGAALTEAMMRREMEQIKAMGANFIRLGHYQQSDIILRLCDELGLLVWEEIPWCRGGVGGEAYREQGLRMLTNMIEQHRHHPSVLLWGLGNENDWPGDFEEFHPDSIRAYMSRLNELSHRLDPSRPTVIRRCDFCKDIVDVYSPTIWAGWYSRRFRDYREMEQKGFESTTRFLHAEWGGDSHAGRHNDENEELRMKNEERGAGDRNGDWSESYIVRLFDWHLKEQEQMPWLTGAAFWTFKDFSTPLRPDNPIPYVNQKGVVQRDGTPKESYYVFQSYWSREPMLHIYGHNWPMRWGREGEAKEVLVYSNCAEVELLVNGISQGRRKRDSRDFPAAGLHWNVVLRPGANEIEAIGYQGKQRLTDRISQEYQTQTWGRPATLRLTQTVLDEETLLVEAELLDSRGVRCLDARDFIRFGCTNPRALLRHQGTAQGSVRIQAANGRAAIHVHRRAGAAVVSVRSETEGVKTAFLTVNNQ